MTTLATYSGDAAVLELPWLERLLLWAIRTWSAYYDEPSAVWWSLDRAFTEAGMGTALQPFDRMMSALYSGWKYWPDIRCVRCLRLGNDERELLLMLNDLGNGNGNARIESIAALPLTHLLTRSAARKAYSAAVEMMQVATHAGLYCGLNNNVRTQLGITPLDNVMAGTASYKSHF